ncbi:MAG TPA: MASE1 domain-containing protein [Candidatus Acidoferrum sp.]|jgi:diguanylate cyclase (GGDEF)-like protein|nr:MASE1 domain-containing protein [Candidatus Acidoferrum sp.]
MLRPQLPKRLLIGIAVCVAYVIAGKLSLRLASVHPSVSPVWPPTGIAIVALLVLGNRFWPAIFAGAFFVNWTTAGSALTSMGIAGGNTLEGLLASYLVTRYANGRLAFEKTWDVLRFALYAGIMSTAVSATIGVTSLTLGGFASRSEFGLIWRTWWLGDAAGALVFTPFLLLWSANPRLKWSERELLEGVCLFVSMLFTAGLVFGPTFRAEMKGDPWTFLLTPFLVWAAFRFGPREASAAICLLCTIEVVGTVHGYGPFASESTNKSLLLLQSFIASKALMILFFAAEVSESRRQEEHTKRLAVSDPLTGLANHRLLIERVDAEIKRYARQGRPFSLLLLDLDGLKKINDAYGHVVGSLAISRVAEVLYVSCREVDTAARYGGDEFAVVLPESSFETASRVARRISQRLAEDAEVPRLSVSIGVAEYPRDGSTIESLLSAADRALYEAKRLSAATLPFSSVAADDVS